MPDDLVEPATIDALQARLGGLLPGLPRRLRQCAEHVQRHPEDVAVSTVAQMAAAAGVQPSAFVRFCQLLGFSGYSAMQRLFRESYRNRWPDYTTRLHALRSGSGDRPAALLAEFVDAGRASLARLAASTDPETLEAAVTVLSAAPTIHVIGLRRAFPVASYLCYTFDNLGVPVMLHDGTGGLDLRRAIRPEDVLIAISFAPYTPRTLALAADVRARGGAVVALTDGADSPLAAMGAISLLVSESDVGAFRTLSGAMTLAVALAVAVGGRRTR